MTSTTTRKRPEPFAHAIDLQAAYSDLTAALAALREVQARTAPVDEYDVSFVPKLSMCSLWKNADEVSAAWERVGASARRVHVAIHGRGDAKRWDGFVRRRAAGSGKVGACPVAPPARQRSRSGVAA